MNLEATYVRTALGPCGCQSFPLTGLVTASVSLSTPVKMIKAHQVGRLEAGNWRQTPDGAHSCVHSCIPLDMN